MEQHIDPIVEPTPERGEPHQKLEAFLGEWRIEGKNLDGADQFAGSDMEGSVRAEWLPGEFFLLQRDEVHFDGITRESTWITEWDVLRQRYVWHFFDGAGYSRTYEVTVEGATWTVDGPRERASLVFDEGGETYRAFWERAVDNRWIPLCEYTATRVH